MDVLSSLKGWRKYTKGVYRPSPYSLATVFSWEKERKNLSWQVFEILFVSVSTGALPTLPSFCLALQSFEWMPIQNVISPSQKKGLEYEEQSERGNLGELIHRSLYVTHSLVEYAVQIFILFPLFVLLKRREESKSFVWNSVCVHQGGKIGGLQSPSFSFLPSRIFSLPRYAKRQDFSFSWRVSFIFYPISCVSTKPSRTPFSLGVI